MLVPSEALIKEPCPDIRYDFRIKTMFGSSLPPTLCVRYRVLLTLFVFVCGVQHLLCCVFVLFVFVLCALSFLFLWIVCFYGPFGIL
jgi:hypothetical protein